MEPKEQEHRFAEADQGDPVRGESVLHPRRPIVDDSTDDEMSGFEGLEPAREDPRGNPPQLTAKLLEPHRGAGGEDYEDL